MSNKLLDSIELTEKQAKFVACIARGMTSKDAYQTAYNVSPETDVKIVYANAANLKRNSKVAIALKHALRAARPQDLDSPGEVISDTKEAIERASAAGAHAAVMSGLRLRGNWAGIEKSTVTLRPENLLSDQELVERLAGEDPTRQAAAKTLLGVADSFQEALSEVEAEEAEYTEVEQDGAEKLPEHQGTATEPAET